MYYTLILILPLLSSIINIIGANFIGRNGSVVITIICLLGAMIMSYIAFYEVGICGSSCYLDLGKWINISWVNTSWECMFDPLSCSLICLVTTISLIVHMYSMEYIKEDTQLQKFLSYLSLFTFFMLVLLSAGNFLQMFLGWEGVGLCSFLLISFWNQRLSANKAAIKAFVVNRIGDCGIIITMIFIQSYMGTLDYEVIFAITPLYLDEKVYFFDLSIKLIDVISFGLLFGAMGKSAQIGLHAWLPDAMEGPTPVSALIHSATMVTAGVFLLCRCSHIIEYAPNILAITALVGGITTLFGGILAMFQFDIKKIIAYSTLSQLGYMIFSCGLSLYSFTIFHLINHGFFKALLFLASGNIIHCMSGEQDIRKMGGLLIKLPVTYSFFLIASLSLMGVPFLSGFYSKDPLIEFALGEYLIPHQFCFLVGNISAFCTAFYSFRLLSYVFYARPNGYKSAYDNLHEPSFFFSLVPLTVLALASIYFGYFFKDMMIGMGTDFWRSSLYVAPEHSFYYRDLEFSNKVILARWCTLLSTLFGAFLGFYFFGIKGHYAFKYYGKLYYSRFLVKFQKILNFVHDLGYFDKISNNLIVKAILRLGYLLYYLLDKGILELSGPYGLILVSKERKELMARNKVYAHAVRMYFGLMFFMLVLIFIL
jgi:NADH-ubiquinone oxidoreductase chain 5